MNPGYDWLFLVVLVMPIFLLIGYLTIVMMDKHAENDDE
jgi:hypothetical protein